jgi:hypothetical protein
MASLYRVSDGAGDAGSFVQIIEWNEDRTLKEIYTDGIPRIGCSVRVGGVTARTHSWQDWWCTTRVTKIYDVVQTETNYSCKFDTETGSTYEYQN